MPFQFVSGRGSVVWWVVTIQIVAVRHPSYNYCVRWCRHRPVCRYTYWVGVGAARVLCVGVSWF